MSTITDWADDYTSADTNTPTAATAIPYPADGTTDLGAVLRDVKKVVREESLAKAWAADSVNAVHVSTTAFNLAGNLTATYPTGTAVNINLNGTFVYSHVFNMAYSAPNTLVSIARAVSNSNLTNVKFSPILAHSTPPRNSVGYAMNIGSPLPWRISQIGQFDFTPGLTLVEVFFAREEYDDDYIVLFQPQFTVGVGVPVDHYRITDVIKNTTGCVPSVANATTFVPGFDPRVRWEYCIVRAT